MSVTRFVALVFRLFFCFFWRLFCLYLFSSRVFFRPVVSVVVGAGFLVFL